MKQRQVILLYQSNKSRLLRISTSR